MTDVPQTASRKFSEIQADLEAVTAKLKGHLSGDERRELLRRMRALLQEATVAANSL
jgi:membrane protein insertase Oxa1/YidC/SpoIIIJ